METVTKVITATACPSTVNGVHRSGDRCGTCLHGHCGVCGGCVRCLQQGFICRTQTEFGGSQGRLLPGGRKSPR